MEICCIGTAACMGTTYTVISVCDKTRIHKWTRLQINKGQLEAESMKIKTNVNHIINS